MALKFALKASEQNPIQQGLKQLWIMKQKRKTVEASEQNPIQQGLKHVAWFTCVGCTRLQNKIQYNKGWNIFLSLPSWSANKCFRTKSNTTRVETRLFWSNSTSIYRLASEQNPIQQGLKLGLCTLLNKKICKASEQNPIQQGLKPNSATDTVHVNTTLQNKIQYNKGWNPVTQK